MLMTDGEIREALESGRFIINHFEENRLEPCSYDARLGNEALVSRNNKLIDLTKANSIKLEPGDFALVITKEFFKLPLNMAANIGMKSGLARHGIILLAGMQIDPGFEGHLRLGFYNGGGRPTTIDYLDPICTIEFHSLNKDAEKKVRVFPELKEGHIPASDKAFLRELETTSLSELASSLRTLTQSVNTLTTITYMVILPILVAIFAASIIKLFLG